MQYCHLWTKGNLLIYFTCFSGEGIKKEIVAYNDDNGEWKLYSKAVANPHQAGLAYTKPHSRLIKQDFIFSEYLNSGGARILEQQQGPK